MATARSNTTFVPLKDRLAAGRALRGRSQRSLHGDWQPAQDRPDPIATLLESDKGRIAALLPIRYERMRQSPFAFLRGAASIMAWDLSRTPSTGLRVQACGDCRIMNFGAFATPERNLIFDINDFDETLPAPWEWDLKRLAVSIEVAGRSGGTKKKDRERALRGAIAAYCEHMARYARMTALDVWYQRIDLTELIARHPESSKERKDRDLVRKAREQAVPSHVPLTAAAKKRSHAGAGSMKIENRPPLLYHLPRQRTRKYFARVKNALKTYRDSLPVAYRTLFDRFELQDVALKVVGIGSVGTYCEIALFSDEQNAPLFLQIKEARASVLEPFAGQSKFTTHGERVVAGQRLMQAASDIFLGWMVGMEPGRAFYVRQLRDMKIPMPVDAADPADLAFFSAACGRTLARAHARTGEPAMIAGYLGSGAAFEGAIINFSEAYADQTECDYAAMLKAIRQGRIKARR